MLYTFTGGDDGANPLAGLIADKQGNLYGTTWKGGADNAGTVFELAPNGTESVLLTFDITNGYEPYLGNLIADKAGNFFGTTVKGGNGFGNVYTLAPDGTETVLHSFAGGATDGCYPLAGVIADKSGNLYGTTEECGPGGDGTVFKIAPDGTETILHGFSGGSDGAWPRAALVEDSDGNLYGTTTIDGDSSANCYGGSCGTVFEIAPNGTETILHTFTGASDGGNAYAALHLKGAWLYGTAENGGADGYGTVFKVKK